MTARDVLLDLIRCNFDGPGWYGGNLLTALRKTDHRLAAKQAGSLKTIQQQALHAAYWKHIAIRRLSGDRAIKFCHPGTNWPTPPTPVTKAHWQETIAYLRLLQKQLVEIVRELQASRFDEPKTLRLIHGIASHDAYHNAQIRHLRAMLQSGRR